MAQSTPDSPFKVTFRARHIPISWREDTFKQNLCQHPKLRISVNDIRIGSFVERHFSQSTTYEATLTFRTRPESLSPPRGKQVTAWPLEFPMLENGNDSNVRIWFDTHFEGFTCVSPSNDSTEDNIIECIAIHGWASNPYGAWSSYNYENGSYNWLRDHIAHEFKCFRVWLYGFKCSAEIDDGNSVKEIAVQFRQNLKRMQMDEEIKLRRPLVFMAHSLGGLVLKEAVIIAGRARKHEQASFLDFVHCTYGIMFFGVPNQGMNIDAMVETMGHSGNKENMVALDQTGAWRARAQIHEEFCEIFSDEDSEIVSCYEKRKSPILYLNLETRKIESSGKFTMLVTEPSATYGREWEKSDDFKIGISATHMDMIKFTAAQQHENEYTQIRTTLGDFHQKAAEQIRSRLLRMEQNTAPHAWKENGRAMAGRLMIEPNPLSSRISAATGLTSEAGGEEGMDGSSNSYSAAPKNSYNIPHEYRTKDFVGREKELGMIRNNFGKDYICNYMVIFGPRGIGKTALCVNYANAEFQFYNHIEYIDACTAESALRDLDEISTRIGIQDISKHASMAPMWNGSYEQKDSWLFIVDNVTKYSLTVVSKFCGGEFENVRSIKHTLFTTASNSVAKSLIRPHNKRLGMKLDLLDGKDALYLLHESLKSEDHNLHFTEPECEDLLKNWHRTPLAIECLADWLEKYRDKEEAFSAQTKHSEKIRCLLPNKEKFLIQPESFEENLPLVFNLKCLLSFLGVGSISSDLLRTGAQSFVERDEEARRKFGLPGDLISELSARNKIEEYWRFFEDNFVLEICHDGNQALKMSDLYVDLMQAIASDDFQACLGQVLGLMYGAFNSITPDHIKDIQRLVDFVPCMEAIESVLTKREVTYASLSNTIFQKAIASIHESLGKLFLAINHADKAMKSYQRAFDSYKAAESRDDDLNILNIREGIAAAAITVGKFQVADEHLQNVREQQLRKHQGSYNLNTLYTNRLLAGLRFAEGKYKEAEAGIRDVIYKYEQLKRSEETEMGHAKALDLLCMILMAAGNLSDADKYAKRSLESKGPIRQSDDLAKASYQGTRLNQALIYVEQDEYQKAKKSLKELYELIGDIDTELPSNLQIHPGILWAMQAKLASGFLYLSRPPRELDAALLRKAQNIFEQVVCLLKKLESQSSETMFVAKEGLARVKFYEDNYAEAEDLLGTILEESRQFYPEEHLRILEMKEWRAKAAAHSGKRDEAVKELDEILQIERKHSMGQYIKARTLHTLGECYALYPNQHQVAANFFEDALRIRKKELRSNHSHTQESERQLKDQRNLIEGLPYFSIRAATIKSGNLLSYRSP